MPVKSVLYQYFEFGLFFLDFWQILIDPRLRLYKPDSHRQWHGTASGLERKILSPRRPTAAPSLQHI